jgi:DmsE family decaheme c-type cytochrome
VIVAAALLAVACVGSWKGSPPVGRHRVAPIEDAGKRLGSAICLDCHGSYDDHHVASSQHDDCESCHGPAEMHVHTARAEDIRFPSSEDCAACHAPASRTLMHWQGSPHARADVLCSDCHNTHNREPLHIAVPSELEVALWRQATSTTRLCASCHSAVIAEFGLPSRHPVKEGMLDCTDCHSPHGASESALGGPTARCSGCHQDVMGPWIYEHPPVTEDCGYCHVPHGATADNLLEANQPAACISCHTLAEAGAVHQPWAFTTACTDCHGAVHGSYTDPHLRR